MRPSPPSRLDGVTVDLWYTLLYQTRGGRARYERERAAAWIGPLVAAGLPHAHAGREFAALVTHAQRQERAGIAWTLPDQVRWMQQRTGLRLPLGGITRRLDRALRSADVRPAPGAREALESLRSSGCALALVSNVLYEAPTSVRALLRRFDLPRHVDAVVLSSELGAAKPSPAPMRAALDQLDVRPERALHVGDQPVDVQAAWAAGLGALRYTGTRRFWPSTHVLRFPPRWQRAPALARWPDLAAAPDHWAAASWKARPVLPRPRSG